jgi:ketosteroid isomerase-like protein
MEERRTLLTQSPGAPVNSPAPNESSINSAEIVTVPNSTAVSAAPASSPVLRATGSSSHSDEEQVRQLVRDYFAALSRHDLEGVISKFADTVNYQGEGLRAKSYIRLDANNYLRRWNRIFFDVRDIVVSGTPQGDFVVRFGSPFTVGELNAPDNTGVSSNIWVLRENAQGELQIISQQESVLNGAPGRPTKHHKRR